MELQDKLPKPIPSFTPDLVSESRAIYDRLIQSVPDAAPYVVVIVMNRLARRWEALRLTVHISRKARDTLIASTDVGLAATYSSPTLTPSRRPCAAPSIRASMRMR